MIALRFRAGDRVLVRVCGSEYAAIVRNPRPYGVGGAWYDVDLFDEDGAFLRGALVAVGSLSLA